MSQILIDLSKDLFNCLPSVDLISKQRNISGNFGLAVRHLIVTTDRTLREVLTIGNPDMTAQYTENLNAFCDILRQSGSTIFPDIVWDNVPQLAPDVNMFLIASYPHFLAALEHLHKSLLWDLILKNDDIDHNQVELIRNALEQLTLTNDELHELWLRIEGNERQILNQIQVLGAQPNGNS